MKQQKEENLIIFAHDFTTYDTIKDILVKNNTQFFTYTPKNRRPKSLILKGIRNEPEAEDIKNEINSMNLNNVNIIKVAKIKYNKSDQSRYHYLVQISNDSTIKEITNIKYLAYQRIKWEKPHKKSIVQCKRCQRLGHVSYNCNFIQRCVKCSLTHKHGECQIQTKDESNKLKCANCGGVGHPASYKGCPYYVASNYVLKKKNQSEKAMVTKKTIKINNYIQNGKSFADMVANKNVQQTSINHKWNTTIKEINSQTDPIINYSPQQGHNDEQQSHKTTNIEAILSNLKNEIIDGIANQIQSIKEQVNENTSKINYILEQFNTQCL